MTKPRCTTECAEDFRQLEAEKLALIVAAAKLRRNTDNLRLVKRPVAFRVPRVIDDKLSASEWRLFNDENQAREEAEQIGAEYQAMYVRDGTPLYVTGRADFRWLIEAPGLRYLTIQQLSMSDNFKWTADHNNALAFRSQKQADALMMAIRQWDRDFREGKLFAFEVTLGNAKAVEHGWLEVA